MESSATQKNVGDILLQQGKLTEKQLELVRRREERLKVQEHRAIVDLNYASEETTYRALAELNHLDFVDLGNSDLPKNVLEAIPVKLIFSYRVIPLALEGDLITAAFCEPLK